MTTKILVTAVAVSLLSSLSFAADKCTYQLDKSTAGVGWTAYKTTAKAAVNGTFKDITVQGALTGSTLEALLKSLTVTVNKASVDSGNPGRDKTLSDFFFAHLAPQIKGSVKSVSEKDHSFVLALDLNGQTKDVTMHYDVKNDQDYTATGSVDLMDFKAGEAVSSLNKKCFDLHKGADGVSKTWSEVTINLKGTIKRSCK